MTIDWSHTDNWLVLHWKFLKIHWFYTGNIWQYTGLTLVLSVNRLVSRWYYLTIHCSHTGIKKKNIPSVRPMWDQCVVRQKNWDPGRCQCETSLLSVYCQKNYYVRGPLERTGVLFVTASHVLCDNMISMMIIIKTSEIQKSMLIYFLIYNKNIIVAPQKRTHRENDLN